ncbi:MAG: hypothetical protein AB9819_01165 [Methanomassiliicoccales archaeon]
MRRAVLRDRLIFDHIGPTQAAVEFFYGLLMAMTLSNTLRLALIGQSPDHIAFVITVAILGCNAAWGIADGAVNVLTSHYQNVYYYRLVKEIKDGKDHEANRKLAVEVLTEALTEIQEEVLDEETMQKMADLTLSAIKKKDIVKPRVSSSHMRTAAWCVILNVLAALPFVLVYQLTPYINSTLAVLIANIVGAVMLFLLGSFLDHHLGDGQRRLGWIMVGLGLFMMLVIFMLGG